MIKVTENKPGHINLSCETSGRPLTRTNEFGMFCDAEICQCEVESKKMSGMLSAFIQDSQNFFGMKS
jgi:hypothetical protein